MEKTIKAYMLRVVDGVTCKGYIGEIENTLKSKQKYVDGIIKDYEIIDGEIIFKVLVGDKIVSIGENHPKMMVEPL